MVRTKTYVAGDWEHDRDAIEMLYYWNESSEYGLSFSDAHELKQARDTSLNCSIKRSLADRLNLSRTFVLIVGTETDSLRAGGCQYCSNYDSRWKNCTHGNNVDNRSYIEFECEKAIADNLNIIVLYNLLQINRLLCPDILRWQGVHAKMLKWQEGFNLALDWDYQSVKSAFDRIS